MPHTLVAFHAHPDDEALLTAGVMAQAAAAGHRVVLVVATRGEIGDVASTELDEGETLGERRVDEQRRAAAALGVHRLEFLAAYGESGAPGLGPFAGAEVGEAAERLAAILREEGATVLTTYDPNGGYHHPDHVQVHHVGRAAAELAGTPVVLVATISRDLMRMGAELAGSLGYELPPQFTPDTFDDWFLPEAELTHKIDVSGVLERKRAAMEAHASQATGDAGPRSMAVFLSIPEEYYALAFGTEWFVDRSRAPGIAFDDVFANVPSGVETVPAETEPG
jgi:LmbE family N-acetylglucosaminyl deacetylase